MKVSVIIVNYNTAELTKQCLSSIYKQTFDVEFQVIVVDNNSNDNSVQLIKENFTKVKMILNKENIGFGRANNLGLKEAIGKYIFFLNSDTILLNNALKFFFDFMELNNTHGTIGALGCVMHDRNNQLNYRNSYYYFPNFSMLFKEYFFNIFPSGKKKYLADGLRLETDKKISVDFIVGADLFVPRSVIDHIGDFDPDFFLYWEEVDLQFRMSKNKLQRLIIDGPKIIHLEGGSSTKRIRNWQRKMETKSLLIYLHKHTNFITIFSIRVLFIISFIKTIIMNKYTLKEQKEYLEIILKS